MEWLLGRTRTCPNKPWAEAKFGSVTGARLGGTCPHHPGSGSSSATRQALTLLISRPSAHGARRPATGFPNFWRS